MLREYENLSFTIRVIKDEFPEISVQSKLDSLSEQQRYFLGQVSDDYGFSKLQLVYYPQGQQDLKKTEQIPVNKSTLDQFTYVFPGVLDLPQDVEYEYYFEIFDNDAVNTYKSSRSGYYLLSKTISRRAADTAITKPRKRNKSDGRRLARIKKPRQAS